MKGLVFYSVIALSTLIIGLYVYLGLTYKPNKFWLRQSNISVFIDGVISSKASVYRHPDGKLLVSLERDLYLYIPEKRNVAACNSMRSVSLPVYTYFYDWNEKPFPCVMLGTSKTEVDAKLVQEPNALEFSDLERKRIRVAW